MVTSGGLVRQSHAVCNGLRDPFAQQQSPTQQIQCIEVAVACAPLQIFDIDASHGVLRNEDSIANPCSYDTILNSSW
jgi:hypothetical protein